MSKIDFDDGAADPTAEDLAFLECLVGRPGQPKRLGTSGGRRLKRGEYWIIQQPGDGKCLFHSLSEGECENVAQIKGSILDFILRNPDEEIDNTSIAEWIQIDTGENAAAYVDRMRGNSGDEWGGPLEIAVYARLKAQNVHVFRQLEGMELICTSQFDTPGAMSTKCVCYKNGNHYDFIKMRTLRMPGVGDDVSVEGRVGPGYVGAARESFTGTVVAVCSDGSYSIRNQLSRCVRQNIESSRVNYLANDDPRVVLLRQRNEALAAARQAKAEAQKAEAKRELEKRKAEKEMRRLQASEKKALASAKRAKESAHAQVEVVKAKANAEASVFIAGVEARTKELAEEIAAESVAGAKKLVMPFISTIYFSSGQLNFHCRN